MIVVVSGLPGTGKTIAARELGKELDAPVLTTDEIRKHVSGIAKYAPKNKRRVYDRMFDMAEERLGLNESVILDGTFFKRTLRDKARRIGRLTDTKAFVLEIRCDEETVRRRIERRYQEKGDDSEADFKVHKIIQSRFEPIEEEHFVLDTTNEAHWKKKLFDFANKMRVGERQEKIIDRLKAEKDNRLIQTHISWVLLDGTNAYKVKKPVRFSFVDYSTLEKRRLFCLKENEINSRLCPDLYLGVAAIRKRDGRVSLDPGPGEKVEFAVKMKELPQEERMDHRIKESRVSESHVEDIAGILADFHAESGSPPDELGSPKVIKENFSPAFKAKSIMGKYFEAAGKVDRVKSRVDAFLRDNRELFQTRITEKRIKNCHGDVRTKNIFIHEDRIYLFDAIEFNTRISGCDVAAEIAFLAMDLDFYGRRDLGDVLLNSYISRTGDRDVHKLIDFYQCYRAMVEALVYAHLLADAEVSRPKKKDAVENCQEYLDFACRFSEKL